MHTRVVSVLVLVLFCGVAPSLAQAPGTPPPAPTLVFEGGVTSRTGDDVPQATVVVIGPNRSTARGTTNRLGVFAIGMPYAPGAYTITATEGKRSATDTVNVPPAPLPPDDRAKQIETFVVNLSFDGGSKVTGAYLIPIYFATTRRQIAASPPRYGSESDDQGKALRFGVANVNVPLRHKVGKQDSAWWEFLANGDKHIFVNSGSALQRNQLLAQWHPPRGKDDALVFVHGFNVTFQEAMETAAQVAYDIGFHGAVIVYSWPSGSVFLSGVQQQYTFAQAQITQGAEYVQLTSVLEDAIKQHRGRVHLLAHSMGAYLSVLAFSKLRAGDRWTNVMFAAPDISIPVFDAEAPHLVSVSRAVTVYFNPNDRALAASNLQNWQFPRTGASCTRFNSIDCIDASRLRTSLTRHSYYSDNRSILSDMRLVTCRDDPPAQRGLQPTSIQNAWIVGSVPAAQPKECGP